MSEDRAEYGNKGRSVNKEDVVQAALTVERYCKNHFNNTGPCDCPFTIRTAGFYFCRMYCGTGYPGGWFLEEFLRNRGMKHEDEDVTG